MQTNATTPEPGLPLIGQWVPQTLQAYDLSLTTTQVVRSLILYEYKLEEMVLPPINPVRDLCDEVMLAQLYAEFAHEDRELANTGLADYAHSLAVEDGVE
jgi:hypothetical protein